MVLLSSYLFFRTFTVFSAADAHESRSSMVAMKVANLFSIFISVTTLLFSSLEITVSPGGVLRLSGETAFATAVAVSLSSYSSVIVACNFFTLQLSTH